MAEYGRKQNKLECRILAAQDTPKRHQLKEIVDNRRSLHPVQCYTLMCSGKVKMSDNKKYSTWVSDTNELHVHGDAPPPQPADLFKSGKSYHSNLSGKMAQVYRYDTDKGFYNDCGSFAEFLMSGDSKYLDPECEETRMESSGIRLAEHVSFTGALRKTEGLMQDEDASPGIGEAYFMGRTRESSSGCNYHFAAVVANDGSDNVTCEANAGAEKREPCFDIYGTSKKGQTFFDTYSSAYSSGSRYPAFATTAHYPK